MGEAAEAGPSEVDRPVASSSSSVYRTSQHYSEIQSTVTELELNGVRSRCHIPSEYHIRIPRPEERMHEPPEGSIAVPLPLFYSGFRLPVPENVAGIINRLGLNPTQLLPNSYALLMAFCVFMRCIVHPASFENFIDLFNCLPSPKSGKSSDNGFYYFTSRQKKKIIDIPTSSYGKGWKSKWVIVEPSRSNEFRFRREWASGRLRLRRNNRPSWDEDFFKKMLKYNPLRPLELCEEKVLARAGLSPAQLPGLEKIELGPAFAMNARERALADAKKKREEREKKKASGGKSVASGSRSTNAPSDPRARASNPPSTEKSTRRPASPPRNTASKRAASPPPAPPPKKASLASEKGKMTSTSFGETRRREIPGPIGLPVLAREEIEARVFELPEYGSPRVPGVSNNVSLMQDPSDPAGWEIFRSTILSNDVAEIERWNVHDALRVGGQLSVMQNQVLFQLGERAHEFHKAGLKWKHECEALKAAASKDNVEGLKKLVSELKDAVKKKDETIESQNKALSEADVDLQRVVMQKSKLEEEKKKLLQDGVDSFHRGVEHGRQQMALEKEAEYRRSVPAIREKAVEDFVKGPVFDQATLVVGLNDVESGWNKALGQLRSLGYVFDVSQLDQSLDENRRPYPPTAEGEETTPDLEEMEFFQVLELVEAKVEAVRSKEEEARARREASGVEVSTAFDAPLQIEAPASTATHSSGPADPAPSTIVQALEAPSASRSNEGPSNV